MTEEMPQDQPSEPLSLRGWLLLGFLIAAIIVAIIIAVRGTGLFLVMIAPPSAPLPNEVEEIAHESPYFGRDTWTYVVSRNLGDALAFYETQSATCITEPVCALASDECNQLKAQCRGTIHVSEVNILWRADIVPIGTAGLETQWTVQRLIDWSGTAQNLTELP
ncbi:MAG: hypothetical protein CL607_13515 [Anaerolineaceae bacterium]|nr:hypothetical protein [Anaerolineaceae bacterium]